MAERKERGVFKRGDVWWIDFAWAGKRYRRAICGNKRKAKEALEDIKAKLRAGDLSPLRPPTPTDEGISFDKAVARYVEHRLAQGKRARSYSYLHEVKTEDKRGERGENGRARGVTWLGVFTGRPLASIASDEIEERLARWTVERGLSPASRNNALAQLAGLFSYAYGRRWIDNDPIGRGRVLKLHVDNARSRWLRSHEIELIRDKSPEWMKPIISFAAKSGMRLSEICSLTRASYQKDDEGRPYLVTELTKNGERLVWPLEGAAAEQIAGAVESAKFPGSYLFPGPEGLHAATAIRRTLPGVVKAAGLVYGRSVKGLPIPDGVTFHTFRHSMASIALNAGIPEAIVQRLGNWKQRAMVTRYAHLADETVRAEVARLDAVIEAAAKRERHSHATPVQPIETRAAEAAV